MPALILFVAGALSATSVAADITTLGARAAVERLVAGGDWGRSMAAIAGGSQDWIALAPQLARGADAEHAGDLGIALAEALPMVPGDVLAVVDLQRGPVIGVQRVCGAPFIAGTVADLSAYIAAATAAVTAVPAFTLGKPRQACLRELAAAGREAAAAPKP